MGALGDEVVIPGRSKYCTAFFTVFEIEPIENRTAQGQASLTVLVFDHHGFIGAIGGAGPAGDAPFGGRSKVRRGGMIEFKIPQLQRINAHFVATDFHA